GYPGRSGIWAEAMLPPEEQSIRSTPSFPRTCASATESSIVQPPSVQSLHERRRNRGYFSGQTLRTAITVSHTRRMRLGNVPPYLSVRWLLSGERNECSRYPWAE